MLLNIGSSSVTMDRSACTILVVDDDQAMRSLLVDELSDSGCQVIESIDGHAALSEVKTRPPNFIITDLKMPGGGFEYLQELMTIVPHCPIILISAFGDSQTKIQALSYGVTAYFDKPVRVADLKSALQELCPFFKANTCQNTIV